MQLLASELIDMPIGAIDEQSKVGTIEEIVISPEDGKLLGLIVGSGILGFNKSSIGWQDILDADKNGLVIQTSDNLLSVEDNIRISEVIQTGFSLDNLPVETKSGQKLGNINDYSLNMESGNLSKIHVHQLLPPQDRIISRSNIISINKDKVVVRDLPAKEEVRVSAVPEPA